MMKGYVDDIFPFLGDRGYYTNKLTIMGRDYGRDLARLLYTGGSSVMKGDDLFEAILTAKGSEITYTSPSVAPEVPLDRERTPLVDWLQDIAGPINYSGYVAQSKALHYFAVGGASGAVVANGPTDTIFKTDLANATDDYYNGLFIEFTSGDLDGEKQTIDDYDGTLKVITVASAFSAAPGIGDTFVIEGSGVALKSVEGAMDNNILHLLKGEEIGFSVVNAVELSAGSLIDHYSDGNAADFDVGAGTTVANETTLRVAGRSSIKFSNAAPGKPKITLDFSGVEGRYSHVGLDLSLSGEEMSFWLRHDNVGEADNLMLKVLLEDVDGKEILFQRYGAGDSSSDKGWTWPIPANQWHKIQIYIGEDVELPVGGQSVQNKWRNTAPPLGFDWSDVKKITFEVVLHIVADAVEYNISATNLYLDRLSIPIVEVISLIADATSDTAYGTSEWFDRREDIKTQIELDIHAASELEKRKDVLKNIMVIAMGQTGIKYPGQTVTVQAPKHGIAVAKTYRIVSYHHQYRKTPIHKGHSFVTFLDLISDDLSPATQFYDPSRYRLNRDPVGAALEILERTRRRIRSSQTTQRRQFGSAHAIQTVFLSSRGATFPEDAAVADGFLHVLTADVAGPPVYYGNTDGIAYTYDVGSGLWVRGSKLLIRNAQPPAGGEVDGDTWHDSDAGEDGITYVWTGAAWTKSAVPSHLDVDDVAPNDHHTAFTSGNHAAIEHLADMLKKGIQPFDSNVLVEAIRVVASAAVPFDVDVNNGAGGADITASAGTPFSDFTAGDKLVIQFSEPDADMVRTNDTTARTVATVNGGGSGITLDNVLAGDDNADDETMRVSVSDGLKWTGDSPAVWFADGTTQNIANGDIQGLAEGTHWAIFTVSAGVTLTNIYADAVGDEVGIIARVTVVYGREPFIYPIFTRGGSMTLDYLGASVIDTILLTADALVGIIMQTSEGVQWAAGGDPGVIITPGGIRGKGAAGAIMAEMLATNGFITAAGGIVRLDSDGLSIVTDDGAQYLLFRKANEDIKGALYKDVNDYIVLHSTDGRIRMRGNVVPLADGGFDLGLATIRWHNSHIDHGNFELNLRVPLIAGSPASLANGDVWIDTT